MDIRKQFLRHSSLMVYLSLSLLMLGRHAVAAGSLKSALMSGGIAVLAGAVVFVLLDARKSKAACCTTR